MDGRMKQAQSGLERAGCLTVDKTKPSLGKSQMVAAIAERYIAQYGTAVLLSSFRTGSQVTTGATVALSKKNMQCNASHDENEEREDGDVVSFCLQHLSNSFLHSLLQARLKHTPTHTGSTWHTHTFQQAKCSKVAPQITNHPCYHPCYHPSTYIS
jgi:hypothetical protein